MKKLEEKIIEKLKEIYDPEIPIDIYSMGLIYKINLKELETNKIGCIIDMTLTSPACPVAGDLVKEVETTILNMEEIETMRVKLTFKPPWNKDMVSKEGQEIMEMEGAVIK
jgi:metal-sulfur cluster biosynthetic enzyme